MCGSHWNQRWPVHGRYDPLECQDQDSPILVAFEARDRVLRYQQDRWLSIASVIASEGAMNLLDTLVLPLELVSKFRWPLEKLCESPFSLCVSKRLLVRTLSLDDFISCLTCNLFRTIACKLQPGGLASSLTLIICR